MKDFTLTINMDHQDIDNMICQTVEDGNMVLDMDSGKLKRYERVMTTNSDLGESGSLHWTNKEYFDAKIVSSYFERNGRKTAIFWDTEDLMYAVWVSDPD